MSSTSDPWADFKLWYYTPSLPTAIVAAVVFGIVSGYHTVRLVQTKTWFCIPFVVGGLFEFIGYIARAAAHSNTTALAPYIVQFLLILVAPILFAASIYMILGRLIRATGGERLSIIRTNWLTKIFVGGDIFCFCIQMAGGGLLAKAKTSSELKMYENIVLGGLVLQIVIFGFFLAVAGIFHTRLRRQPTRESASTKLPWERLLCVMYLASVLITIRNFIRVIEYGMGQQGYLLQHEWIIYVFDGLLMAVTLSVCLVWYSSDIKPKSLHVQSELSDKQPV